AGLPPRVGGGFSRPVELPDRAPPLTEPRHQQQHLLRKPRRRPAARRRGAPAGPRPPLSAVPRSRGAHHAGCAVGPALPPGGIRRTPPARPRLRAAPAAAVAAREHLARLVSAQRSELRRPRPMCFADVAHSLGLAWGVC